MKCPTCNKDSVYEYRPFCSERCKLIDLGKWAGEEFRVPGKDLPQSNGNVEDEK
jgi:endogenous inhibitor of DNA gyrase (YacG/DUF329 family)